MGLLGLLVLSGTLAGQATAADQGTGGLYTGSSYVGVSLGYSTVVTDLLRTDGTLDGYPDFAPDEGMSMDAEGYALGAEVGQDWSQDHVVFGLFADLLLSNIQGQRFSRYGYSDVDTTPCVMGLCRNRDDDYFTLKNPALINAGARIGYDFGNLMVSVGGGLSVGQLELAVVDDNSDSNGGVNDNGYGSGSDQKYAVGYNLKAGAEVPLTDSITVGMSYEYVHFDIDGFKLGGPSNGYVTYDDVEYVVGLFEYRASRFAIDTKYRF